MPSSAYSASTTEELELYADSACQHRLNRSGDTGGGTSILASGYVPFVSYFDRMAKGKMWSEAPKRRAERRGRGKSKERKTGGQSQRTL